MINDKENYYLQFMNKKKKEIERKLLLGSLLLLASHGVSVAAVHRDSLCVKPSPTCCMKKDRVGYWYIGTGYSVPFMFGDVNSLTAKRDFWGNKISLKGGYRFSSLFGLEMGVSVGRMRGFSPRSAEKFRLGTEDAMTYYPYTILGGEDNYQTAPDNAGIWENQGNNIYIKSVPYARIYSESRYWETSLQAVFNFNRLFTRIPERREQPVSLLVKPGIYLQKYNAQAHLLEDKSRVAPKQRPLSVGLGGDIAVHFALTQKLGLELSSGLIWVSKRNLDGVRTIRRSHDDFIWQNGISLLWKFRRNTPQRHCIEPLPDAMPVHPAIEAFNPFAGGNFAFDYLTPDLSVRKERNISRQARLHFPVSKWDIRPEFGDNLNELGKITTAFRELADDEDISITSISIDGYASPEGPHDFNILLSQNRAQAISSYIASSFNYPENQIKTAGHAEDWDGLERLLQTWNHPDRDRALEVLSTDTDVTTRQRKLARLAGYKDMLNDLYPLLRRNEYTFHYTIAPFSIERATQLIHTRPDKLSAEEMIAVANRYPMYSEAFNECSGIAFKFYPEAPMPRLYMAAIALHNGDAATASRYLSTLADDSRAWNLLGVCAALNSDRASAVRYFRMAAEKGDASAASNLDKLENR